MAAGKISIRDAIKKIGVVRLLLLGLAGIVLVVCSVDTGTTGSTENSADGSDASGQTGVETGTADAWTAEHALTDVYSVQEEESLSMQELEARLEARLSELLAQIEGVGSVSVMISLKSGVGKEVLKDSVTSKDEVTEADSAGGSRQSVSYSQSEDTVTEASEDASGDTPYVLRYLSPEIAGVAVVAEGAENAEIAAKITELVSALFDLEVTQISVIAQG